MYFPQIQENLNNESNITTWFGYSHNYRIGVGQFYDMENLSSDYFPILTPRFTRPLLAEADNIRGLLYSDGILSWLEGNTLHYYNSEIDLTEQFGNDGISEQKMIRFGAYILFFPANVYVNVYDHTDAGRMESTFYAPSGIDITYQMCTADGSDFENLAVGDEAPANPGDGQYWLCTALGSQGLNVWYKSKQMWQPVATTYIRISIPGVNLNDYFSEGDTITMNTTLSDVNEGSTIQAMDDEYIVVLGIMDKVSDTDRTSDAWTLKLERKIPKLDHVCVDKNRVWGCHYGYDGDGKMINEIYASKLGDFKNWYSYTGISTDSYSASVGVPGEWTGCISYGGYPTFFKENAIFRIYGSYPAEYTTIQDNVRGVQQGSERSLAVVGEYLIYKSPSDICVYDGSSPSGISDDLGREVRYYAGVAGGCLNKYYIKLENAAGTPYFFVYDMTYGIWEKEDALDFRWFTATENGQIYACTNDQVIGLGIPDNYLYLEPKVGEEWVSWFATTGDMGIDTPDFKYLSRITLRAWIPHKSEITIQISYDDRPWEDIATIRGNTDLATQSYALMPYRCDHYQLKINGHGPCRIFSLNVIQESGSEEDTTYD